MGTFDSIIDDFLSHVTLKFDRSWKTIGHLFYATSSFLHHFIDIGQFKLDSQSRNAQFGSKSKNFLLCGLEIWHMTLKNNNAPLVSHTEVCASFPPCEFKLELQFLKLLNWVLTYVTLSLDLWPWHFVWISLLSLVITPENFMMIQWWEHSEKVVTDGRTERSVLRAAWSQLKLITDQTQTSHTWDC